MRFRLDVGGLGLVPRGAVKARLGAGRRLCLCPRDVLVHVSEDYLDVGTCALCRGRKDKRILENHGQGHV